MSISRGCQICGGTPIISGTGKATDFKFWVKLNISDQNKIFGKSSRGHRQGVQKVITVPVGLYRAHCAVIFAITQLFC